MNISGTQLGGGREGGGLIFLKIEKRCPDFGKDGPDCVHP